MKEKQYKAVGFKLKGIKVEQFALFEDNVTKADTFELAIEFELKLNENDKQIGIFVGFEFKQKKQPIIKLVVSCHFRIEPKSWDTHITTEGILFPKNFITHLAILTIGTSRGILFVKTEDSVFSKFILPTLDVTEFIKEDIAFQLNGE